MRKWLAWKEVRPGIKTRMGVAGWMVAEVDGTTGLSLVGVVKVSGEAADKS